MGSFIKYFEDSERIIEEHKQEIQEEVAGLIQDLPITATKDQRDYIINALEDFFAAVNTIMEEQGEETEKMEERRVARACGFVVRPGDGT